MPFAYLVVEGPHDIEFVARLLRPFGFHRVGRMQDLNAYWKILVPTSFPHNDDLLKRVPVPTFFHSATHEVALHSAVGISNIAKQVQDTLVLKQNSLPDAVGIILDADNAQTPAQRFAALVTDLGNRGALNPAGAPANAGAVTAGNPRWGFYVLPDNAAQGTLEDVLLECAGLAYPDLLHHANAFVGGFDPAQCQGTDLNDFNLPAGPNKARVDCVSSILKPGKAIQVSIQDNRWLEGPTLALPRVTAVTAFLRQLLAI